MTSRLTGTVALVTGASSGIGEATALALAAEGAAVAVAARRRDRLETLAGKIRADGGTVLVLEADITQHDEAVGVVEQTVAGLGRLDTLVNNAGLMLLGAAVGADTGEWSRMVDINLNALLWCAHAALPHLLTAAEQDPRRVADLVNISSVAGRFPRSGSAAYNATKHAVTGFSEALRQEVTQRHVRVSMVEPGAVATELRLHNSAEVQAGMVQRFGDTELLEAQDIAEAVAFIVTRPRHMAINEMLIRPTEQV
ncbi:SDR family NAD(P)-dependent oxidoreductase [Acidothermaceae bacterium B102]|nr:SDR family NAD(P)-dependent oxidoreductase [Acidothermaceae bacterium B102]